jgi:hypothetical protein
MAERKPIELVAVPDYPSNNGKEQKTPVKSVVRGSVRRRKPSLGKKISETFMGDDAKSVGAYIVWDVLIPAAKDMFYDMITGGASMALFGGGGGHRGGSRGGYSRSREGPYVSYTSYARSDRDDRRSSSSGRNSSARRHSVDSVAFDSRMDAEEVLNNCNDLIKDFGICSIADFYGFANSPSTYTDQRYGWDDLRDARVTGDRRRGYVIDFPRSIPID